MIVSTAKEYLNVPHIYIRRHLAFIVFLRECRKL
jgi:hypothetical protein